MNIYLPYLKESREIVSNLLLPESRERALLDTYEPISIQEMDAVALLSRTDTKFILSTHQLVKVLNSLQPYYRILSINNRRSHRYSTQYFDTASFHLYHDHVTGRSNVYKVRCREYLDTSLSYLEVKHKDPKGQTEKSRLPIPCRCQYLERLIPDYLEGFLPLCGLVLEPKLNNTFQRITLVDRNLGERVTIDLDLSFFAGKEELYLDGIAVAEIKQEIYTRDSAFLREMRRQGIRPMGFSKYCFGVSQLYAGVKRNTQKERLLMIEKLQAGGQYVYIS